MLILPGSVGFANCVDSMTGTPDGTTPGVNFAALANDADGTAVEVLGALDFDCHYLVISVGGIAANGALSHALLDVLVDPAGGSDWTSKIDDLVCGFLPVPNTNNPLMMQYYFPLYIPAGSSIGVQARTAASTNISTGRVAMWAFGNPRRPDMWWCGQKVESLGLNPTTSSGTAVVPGASGTYGDWTDIGTSTARYGSLQFGLNGTDASALGRGYYFQVGAGDARLGGTPTLYVSLNNLEQMIISSALPTFCDVPSGTTLQMRAVCSGTSPETFNCAVYGVY